jgi:hypothetical protein
MSEEPTLLEIKELIEDLTEIIDVLHVEITGMKVNITNLTKNLQEINDKTPIDKVNFMHG